MSDRKERGEAVEIPQIDSYKLHMLADFFKIIGEPSRLSILLLLKNGELGVNEISRRLGMTQTAVSHQLRILKTGRLVKSVKSGKFVLYSIFDEHVFTMIDQGIDHMEH